VSELIDIEAAREFMRETLEKVDKDELVNIAGELQQKSHFLKKYLDESYLLGASQLEIENVFKTIFSTRRRVIDLMKTHDLDSLKQQIFTLLYGDNAIGARFQGFYDFIAVDLHSSIKSDMTGELLHFNAPEKYWMWSRWMWDPKNKTGALPLVASEGFDLSGQSVGETYVKVGKGVAFVHSVAEAAEFQFISRSLFGTDVFLSCVYVVYAYTVLRMRMTQEFNKVMPGLGEFSRRLLGVHRNRAAA